MERFWQRLASLILIGMLLAPVSAEARRYASIVVDARSGRVLHADQADRWVYPASLTKMMTLYMTFEALNAGRLTPDQQLKVSSQAATRPPSKLGLRTGERIRTRDAVLALITRSANDAAVVLAEAIGGTEARFAQMMTSRARELGLRNTTFRNASGLPDERQRTTARDMANLALRLQRDFPEHYGAFATRQFAYGGRTHGNHNRLLESYAGADGVKTGYIRASGFNLVASAERDGRRVVGVVIGGRTASSRNAHMVELLDAAFAKLGRGGTLVADAKPERRPAAAPVTVVAAATPAPVLALALSPERRPMGETVQLVTANTSVAGQEHPVASGGIPLRVVIPGSAVTEPPPPATALADQVVASASRQFGVQIGAFNTAVAAHRAAAAIADESPSTLAGSEVEVSATTRGGRTLYRARRMGLDQADAVATCDLLGARGQPCIVLERRGLETQMLGSPMG